MMLSEVKDIYRICQIEEDALPPMLRTIEKDPCSEASVAIASSWLRVCLDNLKHDACNLSPESWRPPKRLIDVGHETQNPRLVDSPASQPIKWLALSYCWGEKATPLIRLEKSTMATLRQGMPLEEFDRTIQDAIRVTRKLDIPYIWIDALCIVQDSIEWNEEAPRMNEIYGGATVTLVVANSGTVRDGFLKERHPRYIPVLSTVLGKEAIDPIYSAEVFLSRDSTRNKNLPRHPGAAEDGRCRKVSFPVDSFTTHLLRWSGNAAKRRGLKVAKQTVCTAC
jgi:hypothetical protein